jgi:hypothetical protein
VRRRIGSTDPPEKRPDRRWRQAQVAFLLVIVKAVIEIAGMALIGQFILGLLAWGKRQQNFVYRLFEVVTRPFTRLTRLVTPKFIVDQHIPLATFLLLFFVWVVILFELRASCVADPQQRACAQLQQAR